MSRLSGSAALGPGVRARATWIRWRIVALLMAYAAMCHFNRVSMSVAGSEKIIGEARISETSMGAVYSAYLLAYTICMIPGGWLIDRRGVRTALVLMGFGSALLVSLTGLVGLWAPAAMLLWALFAVRALLGVVTAPIHPGAARAVSFWIPSAARSKGNGLVTGAALLGIASTYTMFGLLIDRFDWPWAFVLCGVATAALAALWWLYATDRPGEHASVNEAELRLIGASPRRSPDGDGESAAAAAAKGYPLAATTAPVAVSPVPALLRNRSLVLLTLSYAAVGYFQYLFFYWMQYYFDKVLVLGTTQGRIYATIPTLAMALGMIGGGWLADRVEDRRGSRRGRAIVPAAGMLAGALFLLAGILSATALEAVAWFSLAMAAVGASEGPFWVTAIELGGSRGGTSAAIFNTGGNAGGVLAPVVTPLFSSYFGWQGGLGLASVVCLFGAALWFWIEPGERMEETCETPHDVEAE